jgi:hypothetical protein
MGARQVIRYASFIVAALIASSTAAGQAVSSKDVYRVGDGVVIVEHFRTTDGSWLDVHNLHLTRNGQLDSVVFKVFRRSLGLSPAEITKVVANKPNYQVPLMNGESFVFISGDYEESGKPQHVTRVLPRRPDRRNVSTGPNGEILVLSIFVDVDGKRVDVKTTYSIGRGGELRDAVRSVRRGETDLIPSILSGECKSIPLEHGYGTVEFHVTPSPEGSPTITVSTR